MSTISRPDRPAGRGAFINPDSRGVLILEILLVVTLGVVSFILSYNGLVAVALWAAVPPHLVWAVPVTVDGAILVYTLAALVFRARGESSVIAWTSLTVFTLLSVTANAAHAWVEAPFLDFRAVLGMIIAGLAPVAVLLTTHTLARLVVARPEARTAVAAVPAPVPTPVRASPRPERATPTPDRAPATPTLTPVAAAMAPEERDAKILALRAQDHSTRTIADMLGVSKTTVVRVLNRPTEPVAAPA